MFFSRWALIVALSVVVMFPPVFAIVSWGVEGVLETQQKGQGLGVAGLNALIVYTAGSFAAIWPVSLWASYRLLGGIGRKRRDPAPPPPASLVKIEALVLGEAVKSAPDTDLTGLDDVERVVPRVDAALGSAGAPRP